MVLKLETSVVCHTVAGQGGPGPDAELAVDPGQRGLDRVHREEEGRRHLPVGVARGHQLGDAPLGFGEVARARCPASTRRWSPARWSRGSSSRRGSRRSPISRSAQDAGEVAEVLGDQPIYTSLVVTDPSGKVVCSALPFQNEARFDRFDAFKKTIATGSFSLGKYNFNQISGKPGLNLGYPLLEPDGGLVLLELTGPAGTRDFVSALIEQ